MTIRLSDYSCGIIGSRSTSKSIMIENPTNAEDLSFFFTDRQITITKIRPILVGSLSPSVTWTLRHAADRSVVGTEVINSGTTTTEVTTGIDVVSFDNPTIFANSHIWFESTGKGGTVKSINLTVFYTED